MSTEDPRFAGVARLYGIEGLARLRAAHVAIVGVGGVGSWAAEAIARCGVGEISLFDLDDVCVSNSNRQLHALDSTVGKPKVEVMAERLRGINPDCNVHPVADFVTRDTMAEYITPNIDCVIDCIDSVNAKAALIAWCKRRKIQIITTGGAGGQIDPTLIQVCDLNRTFNDPLASKVRSTLRRDYGFSRTVTRHYSVPCVFSTGTVELDPVADKALLQADAAIGLRINSSLACAARQSASNPRNPLRQRLQGQFAHALQHGVEAVAARGRELARQAQLVEPVGQVHLLQLLGRQAVDPRQQ